ncbi:MAG: family 1 glycosylhydrolase, partial [Bdellovibrionales bacterium]|nr:family 1 glycosylhydrolase [Massilia sp.]
KDDADGGFLRTSVVLPEGRERTYFGWEVAPHGLTELLTRIAREYRPAEMYVTENGSCYDDQVEADGSIDDVKRRDYLVRHLDAVKAARNAGAPVKGYFAWSLLDNFEWSEGYLRRFGIAYVDFKTQQRTLKLSGKWYRDFLGAQR